MYLEDLLAFQKALPSQGLELIEVSEEVFSQIGKDLHKRFRVGLGFSMDGDYKTRMVNGVVVRCRVGVDISTDHDHLRKYADVEVYTEVSDSGGFDDLLELM